MRFFVIALWVVSSYAQKEYTTKGDKVDVMANTVGPFNNFAETYQFYTLPFCAPSTTTEKSESFSEVLSGDRRQSSLFDIKFGVDTAWTTLCSKKFTPQEVDKFIDAIKQDYSFELFVDDLSVIGFVGEMIDDVPFLFTHIQFSIAYNDKHVIAVNLTTDRAEQVKLVAGTPQKVEFSYAVQWHPTDVPVVDRMRLHKRIAIEDQSLEIHWLAIINNFILVILLTALLAVILVRILKDDFARYMEIDDQDFDEESETGWKLIHGDVFRFPQHVMLFSAAVGTGVQLLALAIIILALALLGAFYPGSRGHMYSASIVMYAVTAGMAGYFSGSMYKQLGGTDKGWLKNAILTSSLFAFPALVVFSVLNSVAIYYGSTAALPFTTILLLLFVWSLVTFPLTIFGAMRARSVKPYEAPCKTNLIARAIPEAAWYRSNVVQMVLAGVFPFSGIYIELHYIFASVWGHEVYTLFGILVLAFFLLLLVTATVAVALTYFRLVSENHHWWGASFFAGGSVGFFMYAYAAFYYFYRSEMSGGLQASFFFGYNLLISYAFFLMLGSVSHLVAHRFVRHIYSSIKID